MFTFIGFGYKLRIAVENEKDNQCTACSTMYINILTNTNAACQALTSLESLKQEGQAQGQHAFGAGHTSLRGQSHGVRRPQVRAPGGMAETGEAVGLAALR